MLKQEITHHFKHAPIMGWRLSLRTPARIMLLVSAAALTFFSKVALTQCDSHGTVIHLPWTIACLQTLGLGLCALPGVLRYAAAAMRAGRAVIASLGEEDSEDGAGSSESDEGAHIENRARVDLPELRILRGWKR